MDPRSASEIVAKEYGIIGSASAIGGENDNFLITTDSQDRYVLKCAGESQSEEFLELEREATRSIEQADLSIQVPAIVPTKDGSHVIRVPVGGNESNLARLMKFVDGQPWHQLSDRSASLFREAGRIVARTEQALQHIDLPAVRRTHKWDLARAITHRQHVRSVADRSRRILLHSAFAVYDGCARPFLSLLPHSFIHADLNDENLLVADEKIVGILDFGDALYNPTVCDLAITMAYALLGETDPFSVGSEIVSAYHAERPLSRKEIEVLFPLMCGRLATSLVIASKRRELDPDHPDWFITEDRAWKALELFMKHDPVQAAETLAQRIDVPVYQERGLEPDRLTSRRKDRFSGALSLSFSEPVKFSRGKKQFLFDEHDRPYLDLYNNVCHVGHAHPRVVEAGQKQLAVLNTNSRYLYDGMTEYAEKLCKTLPEPLQYCFFVNSGTEANELALRLTRTYTGRKDMLVVEGAYHGHSNTLIEISPYKFMGPGGSGAAEDWVHIVPLADGYRGRHKGQGREAGEAYAKDLADVIRSTDHDIAGFITESVWSCGGQIIPPEGYLERAFEHVRNAGGLCIIDEVQVGFGRVGDAFWGFQLQNVVPDIVVMGKPIGNGHPLGAVVTTKEIADAFADAGMEFFSTFGGNPVSCAIGMAVLDVVQEEQLQDNANRVGARLLEGLTPLKDRHDIIGDIRGIGLFIGIELVKDRETLEPATEEAGRLVDDLRRRYVLTGTDGLHDNVVKIKPPIILNEADVDMAIDIIDEALESLSLTTV